MVLFILTAFLTFYQELALYYFNPFLVSVGIWPAGYLSPSSGPFSSLYYKPLTHHSVTGTGEPGWLLFQNVEPFALNLLWEGWWGHAGKEEPWGWGHWFLFFGKNQRLEANWYHTISFSTMAVGEACPRRAGTQLLRRDTCFIHRIDYVKLALQQDCAR